MGCWEEMTEGQKAQTCRNINIADICVHQPTILPSSTQNVKDNKACKRVAKELRFLMFLFPVQYPYVESFSNVKKKSC